MTMNEKDREIEREGERAKTTLFVMDFRARSFVLVTPQIATAPERQKKTGEGEEWKKTSHTTICMLMLGELMRFECHYNVSFAIHFFSSSHFRLSTMRRCLRSENVQRKEWDDDDAKRNSFILPTATATATQCMGGHNLNMCHGVVVVDDCHCPVVESHYFMCKKRHGQMRPSLCAMLWPSNLCRQRHWEIGSYALTFGSTMAVGSAGSAVGLLNWIHIYWNVGTPGVTLFD